MKLLVISNNPLSYSSSNGRTLLNMLGNFEHKDILNVFINGKGDLLDNITYYKINEKRLLKNKTPFCNFVIKENCNIADNKIYQNKKTAFKCLIRSLVWKKRHLFIELNEIVATFKPKAILIQCGDSDFLINLSIKISKKFGLPLISYNSEDYIFKNWNYLEKKQSKSLFFRIFMLNLKKAYNKLYSYSDKFVYLTEILKNEYALRYPSQSHFVIYNSSSLPCCEKYNNDGIILYSGNLGVGRAELLIELSQKIFEIFGKKITLCSLTENKSILEKINNCPYINFLGKVDYNKNIELMKSSSLILHVESFDDYYLKDTKNAFSTKIADCLSLGVPFFVVAPESSSVFKYLNDNDCAFIFSDIQEGIGCLERMNQFPELKTSKIKNALKIASLNHNSDKNSAFLYKIILEALQ